jgi:activator of HSP90 ATPase
LIPIGGKGSNRNNFGFMARVGEEDDRWIVKDLGEEGRNVNSWHWVDKNVFPWTQSRLTSLFDNLELVNDGKIKLHVKKVDVLKGESILMNRKGKLRPFYELELELKWKGEVIVDGKSVFARGKCIMPEISQDQQSADEIDIKIDLKKKYTSKEALMLKDEMIHHGKKVIRVKLVEFVAELKSGAGAKREDQSPVTTKSGSTFGSSELSKEVSCIVKQKFNTNPRTIFEAFVDERRISAYTQASASVEAKVGGKFKILNGKISGEFISIKPYEEIVQKWRLESWPESHYSDVVITTAQDEDGNTNFCMKQTNFPKEYDPRQCDGIWKEQFVHRIGIMFGGLLKF